VSRRVRVALEAGYYLLGVEERRGSAFAALSTWLALLGIHLCGIQVRDERSSVTGISSSSGTSAHSESQKGRPMVPMFCAGFRSGAALRRAPRAGFEPATRGLEGRCSVRLSYRGGSSGSKTRPAVSG
jgi:hypothetical protein